MYTTPEDPSLQMTFNEASNYAATLNAHGHRDWRVPTKAELNVLFKNRAAIGGFDETNSYISGWYWSASPINGWDHAWVQGFRDGYQSFHRKPSLSTVRCVR